MYFSEPQTTPFDLNFSCFGIPVRVSPWFWLGSAVFGFGLVQQDIKLLFIWGVAVFVSILLHEMGHAVVMRRLGEYPRVVLYFMGGLAIGGGGRRSIDQIIVSAAGPVVQLFLAAFAVAFVRASGHAYPIPIPFWDNAWFDLQGVGLERIPYPNLSYFLAFLLWINIFWALINLLPVFPLDGGQIARSVFNMTNPRDGIRQSLMLSAVAGGAAAVYGFSVGQPYMGMLFAMLAYDSYQTHQNTRGWR